MTSRPRAVRTLAPQPPPPDIYASSYTPELGAAICRRLAAGESLASICRADAAMPTEKTVWNWTRSRAEFALMYRHAVSVARAQALAGRAARAAALKAAKAEARRARGWLPTPAWADTYDPAVAEAICGRLMEGETLTGVCRDADMPSVATVYNWFKRHPEFVQEYRTARAVAGDVLVDTAAEDSPWMGTEAKSMRMLDRRVRVAARRAAQLAPRGYAAPVAFRKLRVVVREADGSETVIYEGG